MVFFLFTHIENITLPYVLKSNEGSIQWYDSSKDQMIINNENCQGVDKDCAFFIIPNDNTNTITITNVQGKEIEGTFKGTAILNSIGFSFEDETSYHQVTNGKFRIKYSVE